MKYILLTILLTACGPTTREIDIEHEKFLGSCVTTCTNMQAPVQSFEYHPTGTRTSFGGYTCKCKGAY